MTNKKYQLIIYFNSNQLSKIYLSQIVIKAIGRHRKNIKLSIDNSGSDYLVLQIEGSIEAVNSCHDLLAKKLLHKQSCIRALDQAGDKIRQSAFIVLSRIEQNLRTFISQKMTEVVGWNWWKDWIPPDIKQQVSKRSKQTSEYHYIALIDFGVLITLMTLKVQTWSDNKNLTASDFKSLLEECCSIAELKKFLNKKVRKRSAWDEVFSQYFPDDKEWSKLSEELRKSTLKTRNDVMHHHPVRLFDLEQLRLVDKTVKKILSSAKKKLTEAEKDKAKIDLKEITASLQQQMQHISRLMAATRPALGQFTIPSFQVPSIIFPNINHPRLTPEILESIERFKAQMSTLSAMQKAAVKHLQQLNKQSI